MQHSHHLPRLQLYFSRCLILACSPALTSREDKFDAAQKGSKDVIHRVINGSLSKEGHLRAWRVHPGADIDWEDGCTPTRGGEVALIGVSINHSAPEGCVLISEMEGLFTGRDRT